MKVAVVGSRDYPKLGRVRRFVRTLEPDDIVVTGGARGVDQAAAEAALAAQLEHWVIPAQWNQHGRRAGFLRNAQLVDQADRVVAFWDGESRGTRNAIKLAVGMMKPVLIVHEDGGESCVADTCFDEGCTTPHLLPEGYG